MTTLLLREIAYYPEPPKTDRITTLYGDSINTTQNRFAYIIDSQTGEILGYVHPDEFDLVPSSDISFSPKSHSISFCTNSGDGSDNKHHRIRYISEAHLDFLDTLFKKDDLDQVVMYFRANILLIMCLKADPYLSRQNRHIIVDQLLIPG